jgi:hypothetical protein
MSVRMEQLGSHWADFYEIWCEFFFFSKIFIFIKIFEEWGVIYMKTFDIYGNMSLNYL